MSCGKCSGGCVGGINGAEDSIQYLQKRIAEWADQQFPDRTAYGALTKLVMEEIPELIKAMDDPLEYADVVILVLDIGHLNGIDVGRAVLEKMAINRRRKWAIDPLTGHAKHQGEDDHGNQ